MIYMQLKNILIYNLNSYSMLIKYCLASCIADCLRLLDDICYGKLKELRVFHLEEIAILKVAGRISE